MSKKLYLWWIIFGFLLTSCTDPTAAFSSMETHLPVLESSPTPSQVSQPTRVGTSSFSFLDGLPEDVQIVEQDFDVDFDVRISELPSGQYLIYSTYSLEQSQDNFWLYSIDSGESLLFFSCQDCSMVFSDIYTVQPDAETVLIYLSTTGGPDKQGWIMVDPLNQVAKRYSCLYDYPYEESHCSLLPLAWGNPVITAELTRYEKNKKIWIDDYFVVESPLNSWLTISGSTISSSGFEMGPWHPHERGFSFTLEPGLCPEQRSLYFANFDTQTLLDLSPLICKFNQPGAIFAGWSPDGSQVAFVWPFTDDSTGLGEFIGMVSVCPSSVLQSLDVNPCNVVAEDLQSDVNFPPGLAFFMGDRRGNEMHRYQWLDNEKFLWVKFPLLDDNTTWLGTLSLDGTIELIYSGLGWERNYLSPDGEWVLFRTSYPYQYGILNLENSSVTSINVPEDALYVNWFVVP